MKKLLMCICCHGLLVSLFANDTAFEQFLESTNLTQFSEHLLQDEQNNLTQFAKEISQFTCLSEKGKQTALEEIQTLQVQTKKHTPSLKQHIQATLQTHLKQTYTPQEIKKLATLMKTTYGKKLTQALKQHNADIINNPSIFSQHNVTMLTPSENKELAKQKEALDLLYKIASDDTKRAILMSIGNEDYSKILQEGIKKLQEIFMKEGCAIE